MMQAYVKQEREITIKLLNNVLDTNKLYSAFHIYFFYFYLLIYIKQT